MNWCHSEPGLNAMLADPMIRALMDADRVDARKLETELSTLGGKLREHREWQRSHSCR